MKTQVCLTVDIEFSIGGAFADPARFRPVAEPSVLCNVGKDSHGLGFMLDVLARHGFAATFFVEALNVNYFGDAPMQRIAQRLREAGHDLQLHLHPCWTAFRDSDWSEKLGDNPPDDSMAGRRVEEVEAWLAQGIEIFARWNVPRPLALRCGGLHVDNTVYAAMARRGLRLASNVGLAIFRPQDPRLHIHAGRRWVDGVLEVPILSYRRFRVGRRAELKTLTITGSSAAETQNLLWAAHRAGVSPVVVLTHSHEFVKHAADDRQFLHLRPNRVNQQRLERLCAFLRRHDDVFDVTTFAQAADRWADRGETDDTVLSVPLAAAVTGLVENKLNDFIPWY